MSFDYGEFCPISMATSVLCERWTLQIVREMILGATRFSEFQRHMPKISPSLLKTRLNLLEEEGIILRKRLSGQRGFEYRLTAKGRAIEPILSELGKWGMYWVHEGIGEAQLNAHTLLRDISAAMDTGELPSGNAVIQITITDLEASPRHFIHVQDGGCEVCEMDTGHEVDVYINGTLRTLTEVWYGDLGIQQAIASGALTVVGSPAYTRNLSRWLRISNYSNYNRKFIAAGTG